MYLSQIVIENFRQFGAGDNKCVVPFQPGVTALVGENDAGKSAIIDAIRYTLLTRDSEFFAVQHEDFHVNAQGELSPVITITCRIDDLSSAEQGAFAEFLTFERDEDGAVRSVLYIHWQARKLATDPTARRWVDTTISSGRDGNGPTLDSAARQLLSAAYLKPLRDASREMSAGRRSRLSQVLGNWKTIKHGNPFDHVAPPKSALDAFELSLVGIASYTTDLVNRHKGIAESRDTLNEKYLSRMQLSGRSVVGAIGVSQGGSEEAVLRQLLERLELVLQDSLGKPARGAYGLGSNNLLFMACELLLLGSEDEGLPLLLVEEPEAHLHPQLQLQLMDFLTRSTGDGGAEGERPVQTILTTHSPNLASQLPLESLVLVHSGKAYSLAADETMLEADDYRFLERFLDATKANLFFARGVLVVEGHAEAILLPTFARLIGRDLTLHGVSIVNVGSTGLSRYSKILQRSKPESGELKVPVACITDLDIMPDCAPEIIGRVGGVDDEKWKDKSKRQWRALRDFTQEELQAKYTARRAKDGQNVTTFVSDSWTLEFALCKAGLAKSVYISSRLAEDEDKKITPEDTLEAAEKEFQLLQSTHGKGTDVLCSHVYKQFVDGASKAISAQHLAVRLEDINRKTPQSSTFWRAKLPPYLVQAIDYATASNTPHAGTEEVQSRAE